MLSNLEWMAYGYRILFSEILQRQKYLKKQKRKYSYCEVYYLFSTQNQFATI